MPLTLHLEPKLEQRLRLEAEQSGLPLEKWLTQDLEQRFHGYPSEAVLIQQLLAGLPELFWMRYRVLIEKREKNTLNPSEQLELIAMSDQTEELTLQRTTALVELAQRRKTTPDALRLEFDLQPIVVS